MSEALQMVTRAVAFAAERHAVQRRKSAAREPYFNHLAEVAALLAEATGGDDAALIALGYLHDTIEDTATDYDDLKDCFGQEIADLVVEVTDDERLPGDEKKRLQRDNAAGLSAKAKLLKIADKTSNMEKRTEGLAAGYDPEKLTDYVGRASEIVAACRGLNPYLENRFDAAVAAARSALATQAGQTGGSR